MPGFVPFIPLVTGGITAATSIAGANMQAGANKNAIAAQMSANDKALQFEQTKYGDLQARLAPYRMAGQSASQRMADLLHLSAGGTPKIPVGGPGTIPGQPNVIANPHAGDDGMGGGLIQLRAPDGTIEQVDPKHVDHYLQLGAERVQ